MSYALTKDYHTHLFGCLTPEDLWHIARSAAPDPKRLNWYAAEFLQAYQRRPNLDAYFSADKETALAAIATDYACKEKCNFSQFQAAFNLSIALNPDRFKDGELLRRVIDNQSEQGVTYSEPRIVLSQSLSRSEKLAYLTQMTATAAALNRDTPKCKLILSLFRNASLLESDYHLVKEWQKQAPHATEIIAIDLCMDEQSNPPEENISFIATLKRDNALAPELGLDLTYHVGESYDRIGLAISASWVARVAELGVRRLGHASSVLIPVNLSQYLQTSVPNTILQFHLLDSIRHYDRLCELGFSIPLATITEMQNHLTTNGHTLWPPKEEALAITQAWQQLARQEIIRHGCIIESCPSSNFTLGEFPTRNAAIKELLRHNLPFILATDDAGIFQTSLTAELDQVEHLTEFTAHERSKLQLNFNRLSALHPIQ